MAADVGAFLTAWVRSRPDLANRLTFDGRLAVGPWVLFPRNFDRSVTYSVVSDAPARVLRGRPETRTRVQIDALARSYIDAQALAGLIVGTDADRRLDQYAGTLAGVTVSPALLLDRRDDYLEPAAGENSGWHRVILDFGFWLLL